MTTKLISAYVLCVCPQKTTEIREPGDIVDCFAVEEVLQPAQPVKEVTKAARKTRGKRRLNKKIKWT